mmetsp:Transcript_7791/g.18190  ORF Transcript_7791/g.18190 Transcript_7791/m.18190 type:complete len:334 (+) Transcript_7791:812-1813(+)
MPTPRTAAATALDRCMRRSTLCYSSRRRRSGSARERRWQLRRWRGRRLRGARRPSTRPSTRLPPTSAPPAPPWLLPPLLLAPLLTAAALMVRTARHRRRWKLSTTRRPRRWPRLRWPRARRSARSHPLPSRPPCFSAASTAVAARRLTYLQRRALRRPPILRTRPTPRPTVRRPPAREMGRTRMTSSTCRTCLRSSSCALTSPEYAATWRSAGSRWWACAAAPTTATTATCPTTSTCRRCTWTSLTGASRTTRTRWTRSRGGASVGICATRHPSRRAMTPSARGSCRTRPTDFRSASPSGCKTCRRRRLDCHVLSGSLRPSASATSRRTSSSP